MPGDNMTAANLPTPLPGVAISSESQPELQQRLRRRRLRAFFRSLLSHSAIGFIGLFFLVLFRSMLITAFKSNLDVLHSPPRWLPDDNLRVEVNGQELPLYKVQTESGVRELAALEIKEGVGTFVDPADPAHPVQYEMQQGATRIAEPIMHISFRWQNFEDAMNRGSRPGVGASFWVYFKNSLVIAFF